MKKHLLLSTFMLLSACINPIFVLAETVTVTLSSNSSINNANITATLSNGTLLGFYLDFYSGYTSDVYFCGASTSEKSLSVPDSIIYNGEKYAVSYLGCYPGSELDFDEATGLTELTLPNTITYIYSNIPSQIQNLHLKSITPPKSYDYYYISSRTTVWVPREAFESYKNSIWGNFDLLYEGWEYKTYEVNVNVAGSFGNELLKLVDQWTDVNELIVSGDINAEDMKLFSRMTELRKLDLSQTNITSIGGCDGLSKLAEVILPSTVKIVESSAFSGCSKLKTIELPNITEIGYFAFRYCSSLTSVDFPLVQNIESAAFYYCSSLTSVDFPLVQNIGASAFGGCSNLTSADFPLVQSIGESAFGGCSSLTSADFPLVQSIGASAFGGCSSLTSADFPLVQSIGESAFSGCSNLTSADFPLVQSIDYYAFEDCSSLTSINFSQAQSIGYDAFRSCSALTEVTIPSSIRYIQDGAFSGCGTIKDVYCYAIAPLETSAFSTIAPNATLHVPAFSVASYRLHDNWFNFAKTVALETNLKDIIVNQRFSLYEYTGLDESPNLTITTQTNNSNTSIGHLTISADSPLALDNFTQYQNIIGDTDYYWDGNDDVYTTFYPYCSTFITNNEVTASDVALEMTVNENRWNFISFPFDVNVSDIQMPEGTLWVIRKYSGSDRAAMTGNTWQNMTDGMILKAGEGYILHCINEETSNIVMTVRAIDNENKNKVFACVNVTLSLQEHLSEYAHNRSWNLIGNPYPSYYDIQAMEFDAPITVWNGDSYTAYSLLDDEYILRPNEAFFVQRPLTTSTITFGKDGRMHEYSKQNYESYTRTRTTSAASISERSVLNFKIAGNGYADKTRLVLNENAKVEYEIAYDASKFMSSNPDVPQIYLLDNGLRYAINERPVGNAKYMLGVYSGKEGEYTISLDTKAYAGEMFLTDTETGVVTNLMNDSYTFHADKTSYESRFVLTLDNGTTDINDAILKKGTDSSIYNLSGQRVDEKAKGILIIDGKKVMK